MTTLRPITLFAVLLCLGAAAGARADNPVDALNAQLASEASRGGRSAQGVLPLLKLFRNWDRSTPEATLALLEKLAADRRLSPSRHVYVQGLLSQARTRLGRSSDGAAETGYVERWRVIGPFNNEGKQGFDREYEPEALRMQAPDLQATYAGRLRPVSWREFPDIARNGYVSLGAVMRPYEKVCGYAETFVHSDKAQPLSLWAGAGGALKIYWNGEEVFRDAAYRAPHSDRHSVAVGAHKGLNRLLVKVCVADGIWGFQLRLGDAKGGVAKGVRTEMNSTGALDIKPGHGPRVARVPPAPLALLHKAAQGKRPKAKALADLARYLSFTGADDPAERQAKQLATRAAQLEPSVEHLKLAAALAEERAEKMRYAARAFAKAPEDPGALLMQAAVLRGGPTPEDALPLLPRIEAASPHGMNAVHLRASILRQLDLPTAAREELILLRGRVGDTPRVLRALADLEHATGRVDRSLQLRRQLLRLRADDLSNRRVLVTDSLQRGKHAEVLEQVHFMRALVPGSASNLLYVAALYDAIGRNDLELRTYREAMTLVPESAPVMKAYGRALLRAEQGERAADVFFKVLALKPQDAETRELLEQLRPEPRRDESYAEGSQQILQRRGEAQGYPTTVLQDLTVNTVYDNGLGSSFRQLAVQVHDKEGARQFRTHSVQFDPDTQRVDLRLARVYRKDGRSLESVRTYEQQLGEPWYRIYYDTRAVVVVFPSLEPGDVVEVRWRVDDIAHRNLFADYYGDLHHWQGFSPVARSEYVLITPVSRKFFLNTPALEGLQREERTQDGRRIHRFVAKDIPALVPEAGMPGITEVSPYLHVSTYQNWEDVGRWYWGLIRDHLYADEALRQTVAELTRDAKGTRQKVQRIHNWVVENTRYVGLEFGIHGFLPYRVPLIVQRGFGDCKDKASLLYTMFTEAGVDARIVLVRTRRNGRIEALPASLAVFDHAIAYVPELDLYLDGTAEHSGTTELPVQDQGVTVLLVGPEGAKLARTPVLEASSSRRTRTLDVALKADGSARVKAREEVIGAEAAGYRSFYQAAGTRSERFERALGSLYPGVKLTEQRFSALSDLEASVSYDYQVTVPKLADWDGDQLRLEPTVLRDLVRSMARAPERAHLLDLQGRRSYSETRLVRLPPGMRSDELPSGGEANSDFGKLRLKFEQGPDGITASTDFSLIRDRVSAAEYPAFRRWVEAADQLLRQRIGLRKGAEQ